MMQRLIQKEVAILTGKNNTSRLRSIQWMMIFCCLQCILFLYSSAGAAVNMQEIPPYVLQGLQEYKINGYEAAVHTWLQGSAFDAGSQMASRIAFFKNIEMLAGRYQSYTILQTQRTPSSSRVYVRMNYERLPGYILFTSIRKGDRWILGNIQLSRVQQYGSGG